ncbi:MAG: glutamine--fructose-6-phosphate transaminase (isomerizing) [Roseburia sp.]|nr:glutamine--fructose-6-phosphate transaminase (isomerizing) [Roseburia sp.]
MCGIIGVALRRGNAAEEVFQGLQRLEYRGYDSAGLTVMSEKGGLTTLKKGGRVANLQGGVQALVGATAIGHTRWATHGEPNDINAHPHVVGAFSVVHNGIIENFRELKDELISLGEEFVSDTDSEVVARLINRYYSGDALAAVSKAAARLKGSFALGVMCEKLSGIIAVKYKSPVVVGFGDKGVALSSDIPALPSWVSSVCVPEDGDIVLLTSQSARFYSGDLQPVNRVRRPILAGQFNQGTGNYPHYMLKEINETESTVRDTCDSVFRNVDIKKLTEYVRGADRIIITGCGTAYNAGLVARRFFSDRCGVFCQAEIASELRYLPVKVTGSTLVLAISQSGETADTVEAVSALKERGARVVAVTNCGYSAITRVAHMVVPVCAGAEVCVAATKSYIGQLAALYLIANLTSDVFTARSELLSVCGKINELLKGGAEKIAEKIALLCAKSSAVFFLGRGADYAVAVEASLKLKEVSYVFSDGYPAGELKHGTLALIDENTLSVIIICDETLAEKCENAVSQVASRKGKVAVITCLDGVAEKLCKGAEVWQIPSCPAELSPFVSAVALQLVAYKTAVILGRDPDKPRNLAKSVTVE